MQRKHIPSVYEYQKSTSSHHLMIDIKHQPNTVLLTFDEKKYLEAKMTKSSQKSVKIVYLF